MKPARILIVEDEIVVSLDVQDRLIALGYGVTGVVSHGEDVLAQIEADRPDLVLMDIRLKGAMDGIKAAELIRQRWYLPVVYLTAYSDDTTLQRAKLTEPFGYILKPFDDGEIKSTIEMALFKHQAEQRLRASERRFATTLRSIGDGVIATDQQGRITFLNPVAETLTGWPLVEAQGRSLVEVFRIIDEKIRQPMEDPVARVLRENCVVSLVRQTLLISRDGREVPIDDGAAPILDETGTITGTVLVFQDVTERRQKEAEKEKIQAQLLQAQKMESVGRLAGGVAHDFNNLLTVIQGNVQLAMEQVPQGSQLHGDLLEIQQAAARSADLTRQLLAFARKQTVNPRILDLNDTVAGLLKMLQRLIGEHIQLAWLPGTGLWPVKIDPSQIDQILVNLTINARDSIRSVGKITIETVNFSIDDTYVRTHADCVPGDYVLLAVSDTGEGMDQEIQAHLFEPFFTTKPATEGTGLGLATVYGIVKQNGGLISVYSEPGHGATFKVYLPRTEAPFLAADLVVDTRSLRGDETVLLVEDEGQILNLGKRILQAQGYTVLAALSPEAALELVAQHPGVIHLLVTDIIMPGMNGRELWKRVAALKPGLRCLFTSGYTANVIAHQGILEAEIHFLQKPFTSEILARKIREVLES